MNTRCLRNGRPWTVFAVVIGVAVFGATIVRAEEAPARQAVLVVVGASGSDEFQEPFRTWAARWKEAAAAASAEFAEIGVEPESAVVDRDQLREQLTRLGQASPEPLWLILIGHGTWNGKTARFNLRGPDVSAGELAELLTHVSRPVAVVNCTSSSSPFLTELSSRGRVVITATRSGSEFNFARFGDYLSAAISDPAGDLDKDGQTSLLEAFLLASNRVQEFYASESRLATEHPLIDDNGDQRGTPPDWFQGVRVVKSPAGGASADGQLAHSLVLIRSQAEARLSPGQRARRDDLERQLAALRDQKSRMSEEEYLNALEPLLLQIGQIAIGSDSAEASSETPAEKRATP